jgi:AbrB family looped-hinge helix DNA binding protein
LDEVKVLEGYRVTIPREAREKLMIKRGDTLKLEIRGRKIILQSNKIPESPTMRMLGLASGYDKSPEEAMAEEVDDKLARE